MKKGKTTAGRKKGTAVKTGKGKGGRSTESRAARRKGKQALRDATAFLREFIARSERTSGE